MPLAGCRGHRHKFDSPIWRDIVAVFAVPDTQMTGAGLIRQDYTGGASGRLQRSVPLFA